MCNANGYSISTKGQRFPDWNFLKIIYILFITHNVESKMM
jgi:hypothetical protein